jgi:hypothetical protein
MKKHDFDRLSASIRQAGAIRRGEMKRGRVTEFPSEDVTAIRHQLGKSTIRRQHYRPGATD